MAYGVVLFHTTNAALQAEKVLRQGGVAVKLIPVPRKLSTDCGVALRFPWEEVEKVRERVEGAGVEILGIHPHS